jgi:hypothetical protein
MTTTCSGMIVIQIFLGFIVSETSLGNGFNTAAIEGITENDVLSSLIAYVMTIYTIEVEPEILSLEIDNDIYVP